MNIRISNFSIKFLNKFKNSFKQKQTMTDSATTQKQGKLNFEGKSYELDSLSKETKDLVRGLQVADTQMRMYQDSLKTHCHWQTNYGFAVKEKLQSENPVEGNKSI